MERVAAEEGTKVVEQAVPGPAVDQFTAAHRAARWLQPTSRDPHKRVLAPTFDRARQNRERIVVAGKHLEDVLEGGMQQPSRPYAVGQFSARIKNLTGSAI